MSWKNDHTAEHLQVHLQDCVERVENGLRRVRVQVREAMRRARWTQHQTRSKKSASQLQQKVLRRERQETEYKKSRHRVVNLGETKVKVEKVGKA